MNARRTLQRRLATAQRRPVDIDVDRTHGPGILVLRPRCPWRPTHVAGLLTASQHLIEDAMGGAPCVACGEPGAAAGVTVGSGPPAVAYASCAGCGRSGATYKLASALIDSIQAGERR